MGRPLRGRKLGVQDSWIRDNGENRLYNMWSVGPSDTDFVCPSGVQRRPQRDSIFWFRMRLLFGSFLHNNGGHHKPLLLTLHRPYRLLFQVRSLSPS